MSSERPISKLLDELEAIVERTARETGEQRPGRIGPRVQAVALLTEALVEALSRAFTTLREVQAHEAPLVALASALSRHLILSPDAHATNCRCELCNELEHFARSMESDLPAFMKEWLAGRSPQ